MFNDGHICAHEVGMTLRDYFAGQALTDYAYRYQNELGAEDIASNCYALADAMLVQRNKQ